MAPRRKEEAEAPFDYDETYQSVAEQMVQLHISRIAEMPRVELYLDQVVSLVTMELAPLYDRSERVVTGSMVNNYVKQHIVPAPERKRYTRRHLGMILLICAFKQVLSISQIAALMQMAIASDVDVARAYDHLVEQLEQALRDRFPLDASEPVVRRQRPVDLVDTLGQPLSGVLCDLFGSCISLVADKVYLEKMLGLENRRAQARIEE
jgi:hypothetical protein